MLGAVVAVGGAGIARRVLLVLLVAAVGIGRGSSGVLAARVDTILIGSRPTVDLPDDAGKGLESEAATCPFAARLARTVKGAETGVDSTLVGFGTEFMTTFAGIEIAVITAMESENVKRTVRACRGTVRKVATRKRERKMIRNLQFGLLLGTRLFRLRIGAALRGIVGVGS